MKKKLMIVVPIVLLLVAGVGAKMTVLKKAPPPPPKIAGKLVTLDPEFLINLKDGHYGKLTIALQLTKAPAPAAGTTIVDLPENAAIRAQVTDTLTGLTSSDLIQRPQRHALQQQILRSIKKTTDEPVTNVMFTDIAVQ